MKSFVQTVRGQPRESAAAKVVMGFSPSPHRLPNSSLLRQPRGHGLKPTTTFAATPLSGMHDIDELIRTTGIVHYRVRMHEKYDDMLANFLLGRTPMKRGL